MFFPFTPRKTVPQGLKATRMTAFMPGINPRPTLFMLGINPRPTLKANFSQPVRPYFQRVSSHRRKRSARSRIRGTITVYFQCFHRGSATTGSLAQKSTDGALSPHFLSILLAPPSPLRLSLMKAAHAGVGGAPRRKSGSPVLIVPRMPLRARASFPARQLCYRTAWANRRL